MAPKNDGDTLPLVASSDDEVERTNWLLNPKTKSLIATALGIMGAFLIYGLIQEKLMTTPYGPDGQLFKDTAFLVLINRLVSIIVALSNISSSEYRLIAPLSSYVTISACNFLSTFCQYEALKYLSFPTQTLGKCGKMIPVMLIGALSGRKRYGIVDWAVAAAVTIGCTIFLTTGEISSKKASPYDTPIGLFLLLTYLFFDGFTSTTQERLFKGYNMSKYNQMLWVNASSAFLSLILLTFPIDKLLSTGAWPGNRLLPAIDFAFKYPAIIRDALILSMTSSGGQILIYHCIKEFGALTYTTIMTTRQFVAIFLSAIIFFHPITLPQWCGATLVFAGLYAKAFAGAAKEAKAKLSPRTSQDTTPSVAVLVNGDAQRRNGSPLRDGK